VQPRDLIAHARLLLSSSKGKPSLVNLRRALSAAYYALFHCLARSCADLLIGGVGSNRSPEAWRQVYRALDHGPAKNRCKSAKNRNYPQDIQDFANLFVAMQEKRHGADYDPIERFYKSSVAADVDQVELAINAFDSVSAMERRAFCAYVLLLERKN
jgi:hypothetical protein